MTNEDDGATNDSYGILQGNRAHQTPPSSPAAQRINGQEGQKEEGIRSPPNSAISPTSRIDCIQTDHSHAS